MVVRGGDDFLNLPSALQQQGCLRSNKSFLISPLGFWGEAWVLSLSEAPRARWGWRICVSITILWGLGDL